MAISLYKIAGPAETPHRQIEPSNIIPHGDNVSLSRFPGGEWHISGESLGGEQIAFVQGANANDLIGLLIWADAVSRDMGIPYVVIPYLPGARQDRRLPGEALSASVYADLLNQCRAKRVVCLDPHSDVMPALINNCVVAALAPIVRNALVLNPDESVSGVIAPDAGATKRARIVASDLGVPLFQASKHRDHATRRVDKFWCEPLPAQGRFLVVDDICDGGGTPIALSDALGLSRDRLALWATHGIFSGDTDILVTRYSAIYTTDSHEGSTMLRQRAAVGKGPEFILPVFPILVQYLE